MACHAAAGHVVCARSHNIAPLLGVTRTSISLSRCACRSSLHRALYWGHLQATALLLDAGAQLSIQDDKVPTLHLH